MPRLLAIACFALSCVAPAVHAQWTIQDSRTTADLRGVDFVGNGVAWASGTHGTVLRTEDMGFVWQVCTVPPGAEKLDFRGVQGFDANTAIVMSSGAGDQSRLYETTDGCQTWKLLFSNPDKDGFWDTLWFDKRKREGSRPVFGELLGDPVGGSYTLFHTYDGGRSWIRQSNPGLHADGSKTGAFAASNSNIADVPGGTMFVTGGTDGGSLVRFAGDELCVGCSKEGLQPYREGRHVRWERISLPVGAHEASSGVFSIGIKGRPGQDNFVAVVVGGDYLKPNDPQNVAAYMVKDHWNAASSGPSGFRSAVQYESKQKVWITVGPNGTDASSNDGRDWRPLKPGKSDAQDADRKWNALSLPFVVGPKGRIGILREDAIKTPASK